MFEALAERDYRRFWLTQFISNLGSWMQVVAQGWQIIAASFVVGIAISFSAPAWQAMVVDLLDDRDHLPNAIAMNSLQFNLSRALGPLLAGVTLAAWGSFWCFFFNAISFLPLIFVLGRIKKRQQPVAATGAILTRLADGLRYVRTQRVVVLLLVVVAAASLFGYAYVALMPMVARALFGRNDAHGLAVLMGGIGAGALTGSLALASKMPQPATIVRAILGGMAAVG